jgi:hypothetical protein
LHIERLRNIKGTIEIKPPKKPTFIKHNFKKEIKLNGNLIQFANLILLIERKQEIQYENRILLRKMLQIDLKQSTLNPKALTSDKDLYTKTH